ncbi:hypothetical protein MUK42_13231 [Musa troglodytarum]|uniref:Uncharacterized protein n=1 Tax=Musa troglodytarum TaxID=320322 RepID=A0A9E7KJQ5_9LILI|nr:hypothetical protein MUK42_13231 [Musa troglodytarum]
MRSAWILGCSRRRSAPSAGGAPTGEAPAQPLPTVQHIKLM